MTTNPPTPIKIILLTLVAFHVLIFAHAALGQELQQPAPGDIEVRWTKWLAQELGGEAEYMLPDRRRVDILLDSQAIEFDWCNEEKLSEGIKQATYYAATTNRQPVAIYGMGRDNPVVERQVLRRAILLGSQQTPPVLVVGFSVKNPKLDVLRVQLGGLVQRETEE